MDCLSFSILFRIAFHQDSRLLGVLAQRVAVPRANAFMHTDHGSCGSSSCLGNCAWFTQGEILRTHVIHLVVEWRLYTCNQGRRVLKEDGQQQQVRPHEVSLARSLPVYQPQTTSPSQIANSCCKDALSAKFSFTHDRLCSFVAQVKCIKSVVYSTCCTLHMILDMRCQCAR